MWREKFKVDWNIKTYGLIILGICINALGRWIAGSLSLPFWFDAIGTMVAAIIGGPVPGMCAGGISNIIFGIGNYDAYAYMLTNISIGLVIGIMCPEDLKDRFRIMSTGMVAALVVVVISTPLNMKYYGGYTGNIWGDALCDMLGAGAKVSWINALLAEGFVDIPDKVLSIVIAVGGIQFVKLMRKISKKKVAGLVLATTIAGVVLGITGDDVYAKSGDVDYAATQYGVGDGLKSLEINAIAQSSNGYIWAGSYSGLYRYDGVSFVPALSEYGIYNVMDLYCDHKGRLWVGTNDCGLACYDPSSGEVIFYTTEDGLASNSIRSIAEDNDHNIYVGTASYMSIISEEGMLHTLDGNSDFTNVKNIAVTDDNIVVGVVNEGDVFYLEDGRCIKMFEDATEHFFRGVCAGENGTVLLGTGEANIYSTKPGKDAELKFVGNSSGTGSHNNIVYHEKEDQYIICGDNGMGFMDLGGNFKSLNLKDFDSMINDVICDYQGNIWFSSNKQGVCKFAKNPFSDIFAMAGFESTAVNSIEKYHDDYLFGCDNGLLVWNSKKNVTEEYEFIELFEGARIRNVMCDSKDNIWASTYSDLGLVCIKANGQILYYSEERNHTMGSRFRFTKELSDGTILVASSSGLTFIKNEVVVKTIGEKDGLQAAQILDAVEKEDGTVMVASDGDGIYVLDNYEIVEHKGEEEGLNTLVVLKIIPCDGGYLYITSNAIYYDDGKNIRKLEKFPYSNNYNAYVAEDGKVWIGSSAGIYIVDQKDLLTDSDYHYQLLNVFSGFDSTLTANAWNYVDDSNNYYLCCSTGVKSISLTDYNHIVEDYIVTVGSVAGDGNTLKKSDNACVIPQRVHRVDVSVAILNYTLSNPLLRVYLEGFDENGITCYQNEIQTMSYTNIPYGTYPLHIQVLNEQTLDVEKETVFLLQKEAEFYEHTIFKIYLWFVIIGIAMFITWLFSRYSSLSVIRDQYEQIEDARKAAEEANRAKSRFLANMSHEIRTPINGILGMDTMILKECEDEDICEYANNIQSAGQTLLSIVNDILDISKIESGKMEIIPMEYDVFPILHDCCNLVEQRADAKNLAFVVDVDKTLPSILYGDAIRIRQIINNLLSNAVKYTKEGSVTLKVYYEILQDKQMMLKLDVIDTGIGIKKEDRAKLFESFERLDKEKTHSIEGTGLGLNLTKSFIDLMNGTIRVESEYGKGSVFKVEIPQVIVDEKEMGDFVSKRHEAVSAAKDKVYDIYAPNAQILVVDDIEMNLKVVKGLLKDTAIQLSFALNGKECLEYVKKQHFDLILLDHMMPEMNGIETLKCMRQMKDTKCADTPVVMLTANAIVGAKEEYLEAGFTDYLAKPVREGELKKMLFKLLPMKLMKERDAVEKKEVADMQVAEAADASTVTEETVTLENVDAKTVDVTTTDIDTTEAEIVAVEKADTGKMDAKNEDAEFPTELDKKLGLSYCMNDMNFYVEMLKEYQSTDRAAIMEQYFADEDWENYRVTVHALKSTSLTIGAVELSENAKALEMAAKSGDIAYIKAEHSNVVEQYQRVITAIRAYLESSGK